MSLILSMTASGSLLLLLLFLAEFVFKNCFSLKNRFYLLVTALFLHLVPIGLMKEALSSLLEYLFPPAVPSQVVVYGNKPIFVMSSEGSYMNTAFKIDLFFTVLWISILVLFLFFSLKKYRRFKNCLSKLKKELPDSSTLQLAEKYRADLHIRRNVSVYTIHGNYPPLTFGIIRPVILLPELRQSFYVEAILLHEFYHIKKHDNLLHFISSALRCVYWFNPCSHLLASQLEKTSELKCDAFVTKDYNSAQRRQYSDLILQLAENKSHYPSPITSFFSNDYKNLKERIDLVMKKSHVKKPIAVIVSIFILILSSVPVLAYEGPQISTKPGLLTTWPQDSDTIGIFTPEGQPAKIDFSPVEEVVYDSEFIDANGNHYEVSEIVGRASCSHQYINGVYQDHKKNSSGGCQIIVYSATYCTLCKHVLISEEISRTFYKHCTH